MTQKEVERMTADRLDDLRKELGEKIDAEQVKTVGSSQYERLSRDATINDFIPLLVYRHTKSELLRKGLGAD